MRKTFLFALLACLLCACASQAAMQYRQLPVDVYIDKMKAGWAGQMIGVAYGAKSEFHACGKTYDEPLPWKPDMISNAIHQDDLYVEMSFLEAIEKHGLDVTHEQAGKAFGKTKFKLWHANKQGRENIQAGIMPPDSGLPKYNPHYCDIDFQIEADMLGLINPGLQKSLRNQCEIFGRIMNSGDGLYGGMFMGAMYAEAFFESDVEKVVRYGLRAIPDQSIYAQTIWDVIRWHNAYPNDWRKTWQFIQDKWASRPSGKCSDKPEGFNIDASLNGAYIVMGMLYGDGDLLKTMEISTRCGQDSDCNPSSAAGVLCTMIGYNKIPNEYTSGIPAIADQKFQYVKYSFNDLVPTCLKVARENINRAGGYTKTIDGREVMFIPVQHPVAPRLEK